MGPSVCGLHVTPTYVCTVCRRLCAMDVAQPERSNRRRHATRGANARGCRVTTPEKVAQIRELAATRVSFAEIGRLVGVSACTARSVAQGLSHNTKMRAPFAINASTAKGDAARRADMRTRPLPKSRAMGLD
jgi:hypothetical protein